MKIVSWQMLLTDHQVFTWREMQKRGHMIQFILGRTEDENRTQQGWRNPNLESLITRPLPNKGWWKSGKEIINKNLNAVHIFSGFWGDKRFFPLILYALGKGVKTVIMNESYAEIKTGYLKEENRIKAGIKVNLRPILYRNAILLTKMISRNNPIRVLAISQLAEKQFEKAGVDKKNIYSWGYFVPQSEVKKIIKDQDTKLKLIFIGNLQHRKGLDLAVHAVESINLNHPQSVMKLDVYGSGDPDRWIPPTSSTVTYKGAIPFGQAQEVITKYDYLILPSRHDGWGVVVNEALLQGVPVILSDSVGAKTLLSNFSAGCVFKSEEVDDLISKLKAIINNSDQQKTHTANAALMAAKILPLEAAVYLDEILTHTFQEQCPRPVPNWEH